jgi:transposase-like protein
MTPDERRQAVAAALDEDPTLSQWALAKRIGCSQKTISRDMEVLGRVSVNEFVTKPATKAGPQLVSLQVNGGVTRGDSLVARIVAEMKSNGLEPDSREEELLSVARGLADRLEALEAMIAKDGISRKVGGRIVLHPALAESRQIEGTLARCLSHIQLEENHKNPVKQLAAQSRWRQHNLAKLERERKTADPYGS